MLCRTSQCNAQMCAQLLIDLNSVNQVRPDACQLETLTQVLERVRLQLKCGSCKRNLQWWKLKIEVVPCLWSVCYRAEEHWVELMCVRRKCHAENINTFLKEGPFLQESWVETWLDMKLPAELDVFLSLSLITNVCCCLFLREDFEEGFAQAGLSFETCFERRSGKEITRTPLQKKNIVLFCCFVLQFFNWKYLDKKYLEIYAPFWRNSLLYRNIRCMFQSKALADKKYWFALCNVPVECFAKYTCQWLYVTFLVRGMNSLKIAITITFCNPSRIGSLEL